MRIGTRALLITGLRVVSSVAGLLIALVLARRLDKLQFSTYQQAMLAAAVVFSLVISRATQVVYYFVVVGRPDGTAREQFLNTALLTSAVAAPMCAGIYVFAPELAAFMNNPGAVAEIRLFAAYPILQGLAALPQAALVGVDQGRAAAVVTGLGVAVRASAVVTATFVTGDVWWILAADLASQGVAAAAGAALAWRALPAGPRPARVRRTVLAEQSRYLWPLVAATVAATLNLKFDKVLITRFFDPEVFAVYVVGAIEPPFIGMVSASLATAILPDLVHHLRAGRAPAAIDIWQTAVRKSALLTMPAVALLAVFGGDYIVGLYGGAYREALWPFLVYLVLLPMRVVMLPTLIRALDANRYIAWSAALALGTNVVVSLALLLAVRGTPLGELAWLAPAVGTLVAFYVSAWYLMKRAVQLLGVPRILPLGACLRITVSALLALAPAAPLLWVPLPPLLRLGLAAAVYGAAYVLVGTLRGDIGAEDWRFVTGLLPKGGLRQMVERRAEALLARARRTPQTGIGPDGPLAG